MRTHKCKMKNHTGIMQCLKKSPPLKNEGCSIFFERPGDAKVIGSRWVYALKKDENGFVQRYKARLVAQGYKQKKGVDYKETYTPVIDFT